MKRLKNRRDTLGDDKEDEEEDWIGIKDGRNLFLECSHQLPL